MDSFIRMDDPIVPMGDPIVPPRLSLKVAVIGDISLDIAAELSVRFHEISEGVSEQTPIRYSPGGSGLNLAIEGQKRGHKVSLLGRVGSDLIGEMLLGILKSFHLDSHVKTSNHRPSGTVVLLRERRSADVPSLRVGISNEPSANNDLDIADVVEWKDAIASSNYLYSDAYCTLHQPRRAALLKAIEIAAAEGVPFVYDLTPHDIHRFQTIEEQRPFLMAAHILIAEVQTARRFMSPMLPLGPDPTVNDLGSAISRVGNIERVSLRYGFENLERASTFMRRGGAASAETGYMNPVNRPRLGERLALAEMEECFVACAPESLI